MSWTCSGSRLAPHASSARCSRSTRSSISSMSWVRSPWRGTPPSPGGHSVPDSYDDLLRQARAEVPEVSTADAAERVRAGGVTLVDVREQHEWDGGHLAGAVLVPKS